MGGGWNMFNQVVAAGDLNGDNRAVRAWPQARRHTLALPRPRRRQGPGRRAGQIERAGPPTCSSPQETSTVTAGPTCSAATAPWCCGSTPARATARSVPVPRSPRVAGGFSAIIGFGDYNYDGKADILGREHSTGYMYLYPGNGTGSITGRTKLGAGWNTLNAFAAPEFRLGQPGLFGRRAAVPCATTTSQVWVSLVLDQCGQRIERVPDHRLTPDAHAPAACADWTRRIPRWWPEPRRTAILDKTAKRPRRREG